jgi:hypothetical protein
MKSFIIRVIKFFKLLTEFMDYFFRMLLYEDFTNYIENGRKLRKCVSQEVVLLANGPSLNYELERIGNEEECFLNKDYCVVNYIAEADIYEKIKPKYYVITDGQFFIESHKNYHRAQMMFKKMAEVTDWNMNIYIQYRYKKKFNYTIFGGNPHIKIILLHSTPYHGFELFRFYYYRKGLGNGEFGTVILNAEYIMLYLGYKKLHLYGVDHNFFDGLCVNDDNVLCVRDSHFYDTGEPTVTPTNFDSVSHFLFWHADIFNGHKIMNDYAAYLDAEILNHTANSMIDAYQRK